MGDPEELRLPYPGLRPFEADEVDLFFGREQQVDGLLKRLSNSHFVAVVGESGAGKSSLVRAGLLPALEAGFVVQAGSDWRVALMRPGGDPLAALAHALLAPNVLTDDAGSALPVDYALAELRRGPFGLVQLVRDAHLGEHTNLLLVVDQFEELFRYCREPAQKDQANIFVELLLEATGQRDIPISVVLTMRSDFIGDCARFRGLPEKLNDNQFLTPRLTRDEIADAIRGPARVCGGLVEQDLVHELCNAVGDNQDQLPLLQHLLMRVWERASKASHPPRLTSQLARETGGLYGALSKHAQQLYDSLPDEADRPVAQAMFKSLTDPFSQRRDVRRDALVSEIAAVADAPPGTVIAVADCFRATGVHMLLPPPALPLDVESRLDISHESLIRQWSTLSAWAAEEAVSAREFQRLYEEAQRHGRGLGELLSGRSLAQAAEWFEQARPTKAWVRRYASEDALALTQAFVEKSVREETHRKEVELQLATREASAARARKYNWALSALVIVLFALAGWIKIANDKLESELSRVHSSILVSSANEEIRNDASLAVLLARRAFLEPNHDERAALALRTSIASHVPNDLILPQEITVAKLKNYLDGQGKSVWLEFSLSPSSLSSQRGLAIVPSGKHAIIWSTGTGKLVERHLQPDHKDVVGSAILSPDGRRAVTTSADRTACVWDVDTGKRLSCVDHDEPVNGAAFSPDGRVFVTFSDDHSVKVWNIDDYSLRCPPLAHDGQVASASFSADGKRIVTVEHLSAARVWDIGSEPCPEVPVSFFKDHSDLSVRSASFSPDSRWVGLVTIEGHVYVLDAANWKATQDFDLPKAGNMDMLDDEPPPLAWSADSQCFAVAGADNVTRLFSVGMEDSNDGHQNVACSGELRGHTGRITTISFNPRQTGSTAPGELRLVTTSSDRTARLWRLGADKRPLESLVLRGHQDTVGSAVFTREGDDVITASEDGTLRRWRPLFALREQAGAPSNNGPPPGGRLGRLNLKGMQGECDRLAISPDGDRVAWYCSYDDKIALTAGGVSRSGAVEPVERRVAKVAESMLFSGDGRLVAVTFDDFSALVADVTKLALQATMVGHTGRIVATSFSGDHRFLATSSVDATVRVWDVASGELVARLDLPERPVNTVTFSPDGSSLLLQTPDSTLVWRCYACGDPETILAEINRRQIKSTLSNGEAVRRFGITSDELNSDEIETSEHHY